MSTCTTHHYACDCREAEWKALVEEMFAALTDAVKHWGDYAPKASKARTTLDKCKPLIARAEQLLSGAKDGKEE